MHRSPFFHNQAIGLNAFEVFTFYFCFFFTAVAFPVVFPMSSLPSHVVTGWWEEKEKQRHSFPLLCITMLL
jgi:hypothetical protein